MSALERHGVEFILVGAAALAVRGFTRGTHDIDFMTADARVFAFPWEDEIERAQVEVLRGDFDDPLRGTVRLARREEAVDLVVAKWKWQAEVIARSVACDIGFAKARVPDATDLVLLKLDAGGYLDQRDAAQLLTLHQADIVATIEPRLDRLPRHVVDAWMQLKTEIVS